MRFTAILIAVLFVSPCLGATIISDTTLVDGYLEANVEVQGTAHLTMLGGHIGNRLHFYDLSKGDIYGGFVNALFLDHASSVDVFSGAYINTYIGVTGDTDLNLFGGRMPDRWLTAADNAMVTFHVQSYDFIPNGGQWGDGRITGFWQDGSDFQVDLQGEQTASHISFQVASVPEPSSIAIWLVGAALLWKPKKSSPFLKNSGSLD